jgi:hypothetical protein
MFRSLLVVLALFAALVGAEVHSQQPDSKHPETEAVTAAAAQEQRGTEQSPIVVRIVPTPKTESEREEEAKEHDRISSSERQKEKSDSDLVNYTAELALFTKGLFFATAFLVLATIGLGIVAILQSRDLKRSTAAAESAAQAANLSAKAGISVELPIVKLNRLTLLKLSPGGMSPAIAGQMLPVASRLMIDFKNAGRTAAEATTQCVEWRVADKLPETPVYERFFPYAPSAFFPPDDADPIVALQNYDIVLTPDQLSAISEKRAFLWVYGYVAFRDILTGGHHEFRYCAKWQTFREAPGAPAGFLHDSETPAEYTTRS